VGAVQRLATMVIVGLVALSTILVLYLADESNRIDAKEEELQEAAVERGTANYLSLCLPCHGPAGEGRTAGDGRVGAALGGVNTSLNQTGINAQGTPYAGGLDARTSYLIKTIHDGIAPIMPAWGVENGGPLNDDQIAELVTMIQHVDWNVVYNEAVEQAGGQYPTAIPTATKAAASPTAEPAPGSYNIEMQDISFAETTLTVPANTEITINLTNTGALNHTFDIDELGVSSGEYASGQTGTVTFNTGKPGEYEYYCAIPGHREQGMVGKLIVQ
jgi:plastocyanin